jgi:hypothetical protein
MGYGRLELAAAVAAQGLRPTLPKSSPPGYDALLDACWAHDPAQRPSCSRVRAELAAIAAALPAWLAAQQRAAADAAAAAAAAVAAPQAGEGPWGAGAGKSPPMGIGACAGVLSDTMSDGSELSRCAPARRGTPHPPARRRWVPWRRSPGLLGSTPLFLNPSLSRTKPSPL